MHLFIPRVTLLQSLIIYRAIYLINCFMSSHHFHWTLSHILGHTRNNVKQAKYKWYSAAAAAKSLQSCPTLCDPIDSSPQDSPIPGILQVRTLEWGAISFSNAWKWKGKVKSLSHVWLLATPWTAAHQAPPSMRFSGKSTGVGCHCLLQQMV